jgi:hypothetical protein
MAAMSGASGHSRAFSGEVDTGWREENTSKQEIEPRSDSIGTEKALERIALQRNLRPRISMVVLHAKIGNKRA